MGKSLDLAGKSFGRWFVIGKDTLSESKKSMWKCVCICGNKKSVQGYNLKSGKSKSCGCLSSDTARKLKTTHGLKFKPEYKVWEQIIQRCENKNNPNYPKWGGRGIKVCSRWRHSFESFYLDMGARPAGCQIDRIDNDGNYEPSNCRWATRREQVMNRGVFKNSKTGFTGVADNGNRYCATYTDSKGKRKEFSFSKLKYGCGEALRLAKEARSKMEASDSHTITD